MPINRRFLVFEALLLALVLALTGSLQRFKADTGTCGGQSLSLPFGDVPASYPFF